MQNKTLVKSFALMLLLLGLPVLSHAAELVIQGWRLQ